MELVQDESEVSARSILQVDPTDASVHAASAEGNSYLAAHGLVGTNLGDDQLLILTRCVVIAMHEKALGLDEKVHAIMQERSFLQERCDSMESSLASRTRELANFKGEVRRVAIEVAEEQNWCKSGLNERLEELGLDPLPYTFHADISLTVSLTVDEATDEDDAREQARDAVSDWLSEASDFYFDSVSVSEQED